MDNVKKQLRVVAYIRVSTLEQKQLGVSLDTQRHKIEDYCKYKELTLKKIISDEGKSGKNLNRDGVQELIQLAESKQVDAVVVYKLDRLTRSTKNLLYLVEDVFAKNNVEFFSLNENIDTTNATGKFFLTIMGAMAEMERGLLSERTQDALQELIRQKRRLGSPDKVPFGFALNSRHKATTADLVPNSDLEKVRQMFALRKKKHSLQSIGNKYNFAKSSVKYILDNPVYGPYLFSKRSYTERLGTKQ